MKNKNENHHEVISFKGMVVISIISFIGILTTVLLLDNILSPKKYLKAPLLPPMNLEKALSYTGLSSRLDLLTPNDADAPLGYTSSLESSLKLCYRDKDVTNKKQCVIDFMKVKERVKFNEKRLSSSLDKFDKCFNSLSDLNTDNGYLTLKKHCGSHAKKLIKQKEILEEEREFRNKYKTSIVLDLNGLRWLDMKRSLLFDAIQDYKQSYDKMPENIPLDACTGSTISTLESCGKALDDIIELEKKERQKLADEFKQLKNETKKQ